MARETVSSDTRNDSCANRERPKKVHRAPSFLSRLKPPATILPDIALAYLFRPAEMHDVKAAGYDSFRKPGVKGAN